MLATPTNSIPRPLNALAQYRWDGAACLMLLGVNLFVYYPMLQAILSHFDDLLLITRVREGVLNSLQSGFLFHDGSPAYRPLQNLIFAAEFKVFGFDGLGYQLLAFISWMVLLFLLYSFIRRLGFGMPLTLLVSVLVSFTPPVYMSIWHSQISERINGIILILILHIVLSSRETLNRLPSFVWGAVLFLLFGVALAAKEFGIALAGAFVLAAAFQPVIAPRNLDGPRILRWPFVVAGLTSLVTYFVVRLVLEDVSTFGPGLQLTSTATNVSRALVQPFLPLFDRQGDITLGTLGLGWVLNAASSLVILCLAVAPVLWVLLPGSSWVMRFKQSTVVPFIVVVLGLLIVFSAVLSAPAGVVGYRAVFLSQLAWAVLVSLGITLLWKSGRRSLVAVTVVAIVVLTTFNAQNARLEVQNYRDYTLRGEWVSGERIPEDPRERIPEDLRQEFASYYCQSNPYIQCP